jgi:hypothetical protein
MAKGGVMAVAAPDFIPDAPPAPDFIPDAPASTHPDFIPDPPAAPAANHFGTPAFNTAYAAQQAANKIGTGGGSPITPRQRQEQIAQQNAPSFAPVTAAINSGLRTPATEQLGVVAPEVAREAEHSDAINHPVAPTIVNKLGGIVGGAIRGVATYTAGGNAMMASDAGLAGAGRSRMITAEQRDEGQDISGMKEAGRSVGSGAIDAANAIVQAELLGGARGMRGAGSSAVLIGASQGVAKAVKNVMHDRPVNEGVQEEALTAGLTQYGMHGAVHLGKVVGEKTGILSAPPERPGIVTKGGAPDFIPDKPATPDFIPDRPTGLIEPGTRWEKPTVPELPNPVNQQQFSPHDLHAALPRKPMEGVDPTRLAPKELELQLRNQVMEHFGSDAADLLNHPKAAAAWRGHEPIGHLISASRAREMAAELPEDHPARITLHNIAEFEKNPQKTIAKSINTNDAPDGTQVVVHDGETFTIDKEDGVVRDGITAPIPDGGITLYGKKIIPATEANLPEAGESFAQPQEAVDAPDVRRKPVHEMSYDELDNQIKVERDYDKNLIKRIFGDRTDEYNRVFRKANSTISPIEEVDAATKRMQEMEDALPKHLQDQLFGIGQPERPSIQHLKDVRDAIGDVDDSSPQALGASLGSAITEIGMEIDPAKMNERQQIAYVKMREANRIMAERGWDEKPVMESAVRAAGSRFSDPEDAAFMLRRWVKPPADAMRPEQFRDVEELWRDRDQQKTQQAQAASTEKQLSAPTFSDQSTPGIFGQPTIASTGVGEQKPLFHEPVKMEVPREKPVGSKAANEPGNTGEMFPRRRGVARLPEAKWVDDLVDKVGTMRPAERAKDLANGVRDFVGIDPVPALNRAGVSDAAWEHATAREAVPHMVRDMLAKVFPTAYKDPEAMAKTIDIINKDNILGGYDAFVKRAKELQAKAKQKDLFGKNDSEASLLADAQAAQDSANAIAGKHDLAALDKEVKGASTEIKQNIARWKQHVNPELDKLYNEMKRVDPGTERDSRGRNFDARINLLHKGEEGLWVEKLDNSEIVPGTPGRANVHTNPNVKRDRFDRAAKFTGDYSTDPHEILSNVLGPRWNEVTKLRFYQSLIDKGAAKLIDAGGIRPETIQGKPAKWITVDMPSTDPKTGKTTMSKQGLVVRGDLAGEVHQILDTSQKLPTNPIFKAMTAVQLAQVADATSHAKNLLSVVSNAQGAGSAWKDVVRKLPIIGSGDAVKRIFDVSREVANDTPGIRAEIAHMAKAGLIRPEYPATGINKITHAQQALHKLDTGARIVMNRFFDNLVERGLAKDTPLNRKQFVSQVGVYNRRLMNPFMRAARDYGISPFIVAGRNFNRMGRRALLGTPGFETTGGKAAMQARATQMLGTTLSVAVVPMMLNAITTGTPLGRSGTPIGAWDLGTQNDDGTHKVFDLLQMTGVRRGLRSTGLDAMITGLREGKDLNTIVGNAITDVTQSAAHPWIGPGIGGVYATLTGKRLDLRGKMEAQQIPEGGAKQYAENARAALASQNPLLYSMVRPVLKKMGIDNTPDQTSEGVGKTFLKSPLSAFGVKDVREGNSAAEDLASKLIGAKMGEGMSPETAQRVAANRQLVNKVRSDPQNARATLDGAISAGQISEKEAAVLAKKAGMSPLQWNIRMLSAEDAAKVYQKGNDDEKKLIGDQVRDKILNSILPAEQQDGLLKNLGIDKPGDTDAKRDLATMRRERQQAAKEHRPYPGAVKLRILERQEQLRKKQAPRP